MNSSTTTLASLLQNIDFTSSLTQSLAMLQQTLQRRSIAATQQIALQAYEHICQQYINLAASRSLPHAQRIPSKPIAVSQLLKSQPPAFARKQTALMQVVKRHNLRRFITLIRMGEEAARQQDDRARKALRIETAKFHYRLQVGHKFMQALRLVQQQTRKMEARAHQSVQSRGQAMLQEYFLAWREEALMSEAERNYRQKTEQKYLLLAKLQFLRRFRSGRQAKDLQKNTFLQQSQLLRDYLTVNRKATLFRSFRKQQKIKSELTQQQIKLQNLRIMQVFTSFVKTYKRKSIYVENAEAKREAFVNKVLYTKLLLRRMRQGVQLRKAYFINGKKLIFLGMLLDEIKENLSRKGYEHKWMQQLEPNLIFLDRTLNYPLRKHHLSRAFYQFTSQLLEERTKIETIKQQKGGVVLKQLIYNYKLSIIKQKEEHKAQALRIYLTRTCLNRALTAIQQSYTLFINLQILNTHLTFTKEKKGIHFFKTYSRCSKFYKSLLESFALKREKIQTEIIFRALRRVLLTERVNSKLVEEYQIYKSRVKMENIFNSLKDYCFSEKLLKKKQRNAMKIRISGYADKFFYNLKVDLYTQNKQRITAIGSNQAKLQQKILRTALKDMMGIIKAKRTKEDLNELTDKEYQLRFKWKIFNLLKVIAQRRKHEEFLTKTIKEKKQKKLKELVLDKILARLLLALLLKQINGKLQRKLLRSAWYMLENKEFRLESSIPQQEKHEQYANTSAKHTSQFQLGSPTFDLSSDMETD